MNAGVALTDSVEHLREITGERAVVAVQGEPVLVARLGILVPEELVVIAHTCSVHRSACPSFDSREALLS